MRHLGWTDEDSAMCSLDCPAPPPHAGWPEQPSCEHTTLVARTDDTYECKWCGEVFTMVLGGPVTGDELRALILDRSSEVGPL